MQGKTSSNPESQLWVETPLVLSKHLSSLLDCDVYLKLEVNVNVISLTILIYHISLESSAFSVI